MLGRQPLGPISRYVPHDATTALAAASIVIVSACAGWLLGGALPHHEPARPPTGGSDALAARGMRMTLPAGWVRERAPDLPGVPADAVVAARDTAFGTRVVGGLLPFTSPKLIPAELALASAAESRRALVTLPSGLRAYDYSGLIHPRVRGVLDVVAAPTTAGVATVICVSSPEASALADCANIQRSLSVTRGRPLPLSPMSAFAARLPAEIGRLARERERLRGAVARGDVAATRALATGHTRTAAALEVLAPRDATTPAAIVRALRSQGRDYEHLARALRRGRRAAAIRVRSRLTTNDAALGRLVRRAGTR